MANRVVFLVDGFNVYYSIKAAIEDTGKSLKWLDLRALCASYASSAFGKVATLERVEYFSAYANFLVPRKPDVVKRHKVYVSALEASGVKVSMGRFKWKPKWCDACQKEIAGHEEKETDVAMAVRVMELCIQPGSCNWGVECGIGCGRGVGDGGDWV